MEIKVDNCEVCPFYDVKIGCSLVKSIEVFISDLFPTDCPLVKEDITIKAIR